MTRARIETALRLGGLALLGWAWVQSLGLVPGGGSGAATTGDLSAQLERWSSVATPPAVHVHFSTSPTARERDWLAALGGTGTTVRWSADSLPATALSVEQGADPGGAVEVAMAAPVGALLHLRDTLGVRDSIRSGERVTRFALAEAEEGTAALVQGAIAREAVRDSLSFRRILLLGDAGWEARFLASALTERGWVVDARFAVAPGSDVYQGIAVPVPAAAPAAPVASPAQLPRTMFGRQQAAPVPIAAAPVEPVRPTPRIAIDTSRYSAVIALDSTAAREATAIGRYLRDGGGLLLWPEAVLATAFRSLAPSGIVSSAGLEQDMALEVRSRADLVLHPLTPLHPDAVALERRGDQVAVAARRIGAGRVLQVGYEGSWRWRMAGDSLAPEQYRTWVAGLASQVALVGRISREVAGRDPAPLAGLHARFGAPTLASAQGEAERPALSGWLLALLVLLFLGEWTSRRTRGVP